MALPPHSNSRLSQDPEHFRVLVVDDDTTILTLLKEVLSLVPGCNVITASNPADAMNIIVKENIDIVFTDIHMPGVTGIEMLKDIVSLQKTPEVIIMTAYPSGEIAQSAMELGATSLLAKPFENIALVELELEKAVKRILRQRATRSEVEKQKEEMKKKGSGQIDNDPLLKITLPEPPPPEKPLQSIPAPSSTVRTPVAAQATSVAPKSRPSDVTSEPRKIQSGEIMESLIEVEMPRAERYNRPFAVGFVDLPENFQLSLPSEIAEHRQKLINQVDRCIRRSDALFDAGKDGVGILLFECNRIGADVVEHKLRTAGLTHTGFAIFPQDASKSTDLIKQAKQYLNNKRKFHIVLYEPEEFFGRIVQNMLIDPKYHVSWAQSEDETYRLVNREAEGIKLFLISLSRDPKQWQLLLKFRKENLIQWPIVLFIDIPITKELKAQLRQLGVRCVVNKGVSQEEFLYIVQSFVIPRPAMDERKNFRALVTVPLVFEVNGSSQSSNSFTLSQDGVFIRDMNPPASGTRIKLKMFVPGFKDAIETQGEVIYAVPYFVGVNRFHVSGMAVKFVNMPDEKRELIDQFVSACLTSYLI